MSQNQIEDMVGVVRTVKVRDRVITVREVDMEGLTPFAAACAPFLAEFDEAGALAERNGKPPEDFALFKVLAAHGPAFLTAASLVCDAPRDFLGKLRPDEFFNVAAKVVEVNGGFFVTRLAPALIGFARGISLVGSILSTGSSAPATDDPQMSSSWDTLHSTPSSTPASMTKTDATG